MGSPPRRLPATPTELEENLGIQNKYNPQLIKEIVGTYSGNMQPGAEAVLAEDTVYSVWRGFLRAYRDAGGTTHDHADEAVNKTFEDFGDLDAGFQTWWMDEGRELFTEQGELPIVTVVDIDKDWVGEDEYPKHITLRVPLTISRAAILSQLNSVLAQCHIGSKLHRHRHSTAQYKLHPRSKYIKSHYERMLAVWKLVKEHRNQGGNDMPWWNIAHLANIAPGMNPFNGNNGLEREDVRRHLTNLARGLYAKAESVMEHAIRGVFPYEPDDEEV